MGLFWRLFYRGPPQDGGDYAWAMFEVRALFNDESFGGIPEAHC